MWEILAVIIVLGFIFKIGFEIAKANKALSEKNRQNSEQSREEAAIVTPVIMNTCLDSHCHQHHGNVDHSSHHHSHGVDSGGHHHSSGDFGGHHCGSFDGGCHSGGHH